MVTPRILTVAYAVVAVTLGAFSFGLHTLSRGVLLSLFVLGFCAAALIVVDGWAKVVEQRTDRSKKNGGQ